MYTLHIQTGTVTREADGVEVAPCQSAEDPDFLAYIDWVNQGNEPRIVDYPMPTVPQQITMRQAQQALLEAGLLDTVETAVSFAPRSVQIDWQKGSIVERNSHTVTLLQAQMGKTDWEIDQLFIRANEL